MSLMRNLLVGLIFIITPLAAHDHYSDWVNRKGQECCTDQQDCRALSNEDERTVAGKLEVRVEGAWCPVLPHHYLKTGNAPNWQTSHICVVRKLDDGFQCERFICYQSKPGF